MATTNGIVGSVLSTLNNSSILADPIGTRVGSFFFGPNQILAFRYNAPQGKVTGGTSYSDEQSFGRSLTRSKHHNIHVAFYTKTDVKDVNTGYKNEELVLDYLDKIEQAVITNVAGSIGNLCLETSEIEEDPFFVPESGIYGGRYLFVFKDRR